MELDFFRKRRILLNAAFSSVASSFISPISANAGEAQESEMIEERRAFIEAAMKKWNEPKGAVIVTPKEGEPAPLATIAPTGTLLTRQ